MASAGRAGAAAVALTAGLTLFGKLPTLADAMVQLLQARSWAAGALGAPLSDQTASRLVQNGVLASPGWVSVYPPGHTALLALGFGLGVP